MLQKISNNILFFKNAFFFLLSIHQKKKSNDVHEQKQHMISEGSCDTEDWSNDAENTALISGINYILKQI